MLQVINGISEFAIQMPAVKLYTLSTAKNCLPELRHRAHELIVDLLRHVQILPLSLNWHFHLLAELNESNERSLDEAK